MAVITEFYTTREDGTNLYRTYSDKGLMLLQNESGKEYSDAVDVENSGYTYTEIEGIANAQDISAEEALDIILGGDT